MRITNKHTLGWTTLLALAGLTGCRPAPVATNPAPQPAVPAPPAPTATQPEGAKTVGPSTRTATVSKPSPKVGPPAPIGPKLPDQATPPANTPPPSRVILPPNPPPVISTWSSVPEYREAEMRLARFITALQLGRRERAVAFLSSRVPLEDRAALMEKRWLRKDFNRRDDFAQLLFVRDLQIRPIGAIRNETLRLAVIPRNIPVNVMNPNKSKDLVGRLEVRMRRENGEWWVELRPDPKA